MPCASGRARWASCSAVDLVFALSSIIVPFAFGAAIGGIASGRVPVGNAQGDTFTSWVNWTSFLVGVLAVAVAAYLAAVYLAADAMRLGEPELAEAFRVRALGMGVAAGAIAMAGLLVVRHDARPIWDGLTSGWGLGAVVVSALAGGATMLLVWMRRYGPARGTAAAAVAAVARRLGARPAPRRAAGPVDPPGRGGPLDARRARDRDRDRRGAADPVARDPLRAAAARPLRRRGPRRAPEGSARRRPVSLAARAGRRRAARGRERC